VFYAVGLKCGHPQTLSLNESETVAFRATTSLHLYSCLAW